ncbi:MAG: hypothetical protein BWX68_00450 [Verrucomicrobia bacterium ADurb.Bin063]|nr:MAG: hypothetical protein BWX68_00450 [Verrucomicrobia bacterium ADurb.Bin063]
MAAVADAALPGVERRVGGVDQQIPIQVILDARAVGFEAQRMPAAPGHVGCGGKEIGNDAIHQFAGPQAAVVVVPKQRVAIARALVGGIQPGEAIIAQVNAIAFPLAAAEIGRLVAEIDGALHIIIAVARFAHGHRFARAGAIIGLIGHEQRLPISARGRGAERLDRGTVELGPAEHGLAGGGEVFGDGKVVIGKAGKVEIGVGELRIHHHARGGLDPAPRGRSARHRDAVVAVGSLVGHKPAAAEYNLPDLRRAVAGRRPDRVFRRQLSQVDVGSTVGQRLNDRAREHLLDIGRPQPAGAIRSIVRDEDVVITALGIAAEIKLVLPGGADLRAAVEPPVANRRAGGGHLHHPPQLVRAVRIEHNRVFKVRPVKRAGRRARAAQVALKMQMLRVRQAGIVGKPDLVAHIDPLPNADRGRKHVAIDQVDGLAIGREAVHGYFDVVAIVRVAVVVGRIARVGGDHRAGGGGVKRRARLHREIRANMGVVGIGGNKARPGPPRPIGDARARQQIHISLLDKAVRKGQDFIRPRGHGLRREGRQTKGAEGNQFPVILEVHKVMAPGLYAQNPA